MKSKGLTEAQFLSLLQKVLPEALSDPHLANTVFERIAEELRLMKSLDRFQKFCAQGSLPDLEPATVANLQTDLAATFGEANVAVTPTETGDAVDVQISLPDRTVTSQLKIKDPATVEAEEEESKARFVPFPVALPEDPDLLWVLAPA